MNAREVALDLLTKQPRARQLADELLDEQLERGRLSPTERRLATELFYGCLRNKLALEHLLAQLAPKQPREVVANILKIGLYQLFHLSKIPDHAAVNAAVELTKAQASVAEARFVNATMRRAAAERDALAAKLNAIRESEPWIFHSHPRWLFERWERRWGISDAISLCEWNNRPPSIYIRVNTLKTAAKPEEIKAEPSSFHPLCWKVGNSTDIFHSKSWTEGAIYAQDPSTLVAVDALEPRPNDTVLDMCAAPGGKTTYIAQKMQNRGQIVAADESNQRLRLVAENCKRLGVDIVAAIACSGTRLDRCLRGKLFDRVLVDAPCSNTGVMRRRADLRWRIRAEEIQRLARLQGNLLRVAAALTKPGGALVYSTCSLEPEENEQVVAAFRETRGDFSLEMTRSVLPPRDGVDGAFVARFTRQ